jgi:hypothetical protein
LDIVVTFAVLALALAALAYPLYRARSQSILVNASTLDDLLAQRDGVYATLRDLELDQQLGKLDAADYNALREKYMRRATEILNELDSLRGEGGAKAASDEIEREVAAMRLRPPTPPVAEGEMSSAPREAASTQKCPNCGSPTIAGDKFCARCGHALGPTK